MIQFVFILISIVTINAMAFENLVYTWRGFPHDIAQGSIAINDLNSHAKQIDILSSQAYHINEKGIVYGSLNPQMLVIARASHVKIMPLVGNTNFDSNLVHIFLNDNVAQERAIQSLLQLGKQYHFDGLQIDFEGMSFTDRDAFTRFYQKLASKLHQNGFQVSIAIIPMLTSDIPETDYLKGKYQGWSGVYDYKAIGDSSDFVTLMAYDQHGSITTPGPMAGITWDDAIIQYALKYLPPEKISLGIPWHSGYWYTGKNASASTANPLHAVATDLKYPDMLRLLKDNNVTLKWDETDKVHFAIYRNHFLYEYMYVEDADSFKAKLDLIKKYKLRGISNWCLGEEDPKVWDFLPSKG